MLAGILIIGIVVGLGSGVSVFIWTGGVWLAIMSYSVASTATVLLLALYIGLKSEHVAAQSQTSAHNSREATVAVFRSLPDV